MHTLLPSQYILFERINDDDDDDDVVSKIAWKRS